MIFKSTLGFFLGSVIGCGILLLPLGLSPRLQSTINAHKEGSNTIEVSYKCESIRIFCKAEKLLINREVYVNKTNSYYCDFNSNLYKVNTKYGNAVKQDGYKCEYTLTKKPSFIIEFLE